MCTVLRPPGDNPVAVNKYIMSVSKAIVSFPKLVEKYCFKENHGGYKMGSKHTT